MLNLRKNKYCYIPLIPKKKFNLDFEADLKEEY